VGIFLINTFGVLSAFIRPHSKLRHKVSLPTFDPETSTVPKAENLGLAFYGVQMSPVPLGREAH
jgi:hypothetical protein